ncbi:MAG: preprotein translocase subunit SecE [Chloroflexaceae bacterium]|nr:preprotein translocase subunit SecE [Chloroflexaceae bacterium]
MTVVKQKEKEQQRDTGVVQLFRDTRAELKKVVWPTREETVRLTILVLFVSALVGVFLFGADSIFLWLYTLLVSLV